MLTQAERKQLERDRKAFEAIEARGVKKGLAQGREQGLAQGRGQGLAQGREQGLAVLVRVFTRKLGRPVTDRERATLVRRLDSLGADRLGDVVLDLDAPALAAWLANPRAR
jgi:flagellar biosynthesis/type III secretory pathway protein FliH